MAHQFVLEIYEKTEFFPKHELYGIVSQLRRAAVSVPTNLVEGYSRNTKKGFINFLTISIGSLAECEYLMELSRDLQYLNMTAYDSLESLRKQVSVALYRFRESQRKISDHTVE